MASLLSNLVNNLSEELHRIKCKLGLVELNISIETVFLNTQILKMI